MAEEQGGKMETETMRALALHAVGDLRYERIPIPAIPSGWVRVRIGFCGVCGSDIPRVFVKGTYSFPTVCGHEFAGTVDACGEGVTGFAPGDRVAVFPLLWCGRCQPCEQGKYVQCESYDYLGSRRDGGFAEFVTAPVPNLVRVPDGVSLEAAAMTEPCAVALHALRRTEARLGDTVAVFGAGPIGLMTAQWARAMGAAKVMVFDILPDKLAMARSMGFELAFDSREQDPVKRVESLTGGAGASVCIEGAGVPATLVAALRACRRGGRVAMLGNPSADVTVPAALLSQAMRREVSILGVWNSDYSARGGDDDWRASLDAMAAGTIRLEPLITHRVPLDRAAEALTMMRDQSEFYAKVLIDPAAREHRT
jgi:L-iditol 2-dehydrogenase